MDSLNSEITGSNQTFTTSDGKYIVWFLLVKIPFSLSLKFSLIEKKKEKRERKFFCFRFGLFCFVFWSRRPFIWHTRVCVCVWIVLCFCCTWMKWEHFSWIERDLWVFGLPLWGCTLVFTIARFVVFLPLLLFYFVF